MHQRTTPTQLTHQFRLSEEALATSVGYFLPLLLFWSLPDAFLWHYLSGFESTDDAQVDAPSLSCQRSHLRICSEGPR